MDATSMMASAMSGMSDMSNMPMSSTAAPTASSSAMAMGGMSGMGDMDSSMDMGSGACKISMLWNWYTVDACFISSTWHVTSKGAFAGSCIGVILLVCVLELLRRASREYDRMVLAKNAPSFTRDLNSCETNQNLEGPNLKSDAGKLAPTFVAAVSSSSSSSNQEERHNGASSGAGQRRTRRPKVLQQVIRALLHMSQFAVAYFIMLLAMYFNGYIIICIFIGAFVGAFLFTWDLGNDGVVGGGGEVSGCCG